MSERFSFEVVDALDYDELRPGYSPEAVAWVAERGGLGVGSLAVDLAAGTGQLSRHLVSRGIDVVAVEPASNMRAVLGEQLPSVRILDGTAEAIPLDDGVVDAVVVGNRVPSLRAGPRARRDPTGPSLPRSAGAVLGMAIRG